MIESVYCDFTKLPDDTGKDKRLCNQTLKGTSLYLSRSGFQTWIGLTDVKSSSTYFYGQRNEDFNQTNTPIPFDVVRLNEGGAFDGATGIFTAPANGKYFFSFVGLAHLPATSSPHYLGISLQVNNGEIGKAFVEEAGNNPTRERVPLTLQSTLYLKKGDQVCLKIRLQTNGSLLTDDGNHFAHFNGWLLEEDISQSLKIIT